MAEMKVKKEPTLPTGRLLWLILAIAANLYLVFGAADSWKTFIGGLTVFFWFKFVTGQGLEMEKYPALHGSGVCQMTYCVFEN